MTIAAQTIAEATHSSGITTPLGRYQGGSSPSRGPSVRVTTDGPSPPASRISRVEPMMLQTATRWSRCQAVPR